MRLYGEIKTITVQKTLPAAGDYSANDVMSESATVGTAWKFADIVNSGGCGEIIGAQLILSKSGGITAITPQCTLFLFSAPPTSQLNDNLANTAPLDADVASYLGKIEFNPLSNNGGSPDVVATPSTAGALPLPFCADPKYKDIWGILVIATAEANETAATVATIKLKVLY